MFKDSTIRRPQDISPEEWNRMQDRGRAMAERTLCADPLKRLQLESVFGVEYCKARYPQAYKGVA